MHFDDYNWDWSLVDLQGQVLLPHSVLLPGRPVVRHIGREDGLHMTGKKQRQATKYESQYLELNTRLLDKNVMVTQK
jgi:hypothetical protein